MASRNPSRPHDNLPRSTSTTSAPSIRRNLFASHITRRPTAASTTTSSTTTQTVHSDESASSKEDIIVRDEHGNYRLDLPTMTPLPRDEAREERDVENRLIETYRKHQKHIEPNELRASLQSSLQAKVASLDEDKWMFGEEDNTIP